MAIEPEKETHPQRGAKVVEMPLLKGPSKADPGVAFLEDMDPVPERYSSKG